MAGQREQIGRQLRALYEAGNQSQLRALLSQADTATILRNLRYYEYLYAARRDKIQVYVETGQRLASLEQDIADSIASLQASQVALEAENAALQAERDARKKLADDADARLRDKGSSLEKLQQDRTALQKVIERIEQQRALAKAEEEKRQREAAEQQQREAAEKRRQEELARQPAVQPSPAQPAQQTVGEPAAPAPEPPAPVAVNGSDTPTPAAYSSDDLKRLQSQSFNQRKGKMGWPVSGKLLNKFGETRQGSVQWDGLRIQSAPGSEVKAIHSGRVMYADWLRGQGMLIVLDHGDGYMSLYAHNDALLREPGEWVQPGDSIARVGNSGGEKEAGLYFEIRRDGKPVDPLPWLDRR